MGYLDKRNQIDSFQESISSFGELSEDLKKKITYKFRLDWNYYSNSMEGNTLTMGETRSVMVGNLTVGGKPIKDVLEMKGHDEVITEILKIGQSESRLSEKRIREIHNGIMHEEDESKKNMIGSWKTEPNWIINYKGERFDFVEPADVPARIHDLLNKTNAAIDALKQQRADAPHPIDIALDFHLEYVIIHPFYDGNGRTARILTNLLLISFGYPPFWVKSNDRKAYNQYIADIQGYGGNPDLFYEFAAEQILYSQKIILNALEGNEINDSDDLDKELALLKAQLKGEPVLNSKANPENIIAAAEDNFIPLFIWLESKCESLKEFFFESNRRINYETDGGDGQQTVDTNDNSWDSIKAYWLQTKLKTEGKKLRRILYTYELKGFKNNLNGNSIWLNVEVNFGEFNYSVQTNQNRDRPKLLPYLKKLTTDELTEIGSPMIKQLIEEIKRLNG